MRTVTHRSLSPSVTNSVSSHTLCSYADAFEAARQNPLAVLHLMSPHMLIIVLWRHGPLGQLAQLGSVVRSCVRDVSALLTRKTCTPLCIAFYFSCSLGGVGPVSNPVFCIL